MRNIKAIGRLAKPEEFGEIVVKANQDGSVVRIRDVARTDPARAAHLLKAWIESDSEQRS